jgi:hypothetical protein
MAGYWDDEETIVWPVKAKVLKGDGTKTVKTVPFKVKFNLLSQEELKKAPSFGEEATVEEKIAVIEARHEIAVNNILEFYELPDITYTPENLTKVLNKRPFFEAITTGFWDAQLGRV